MGSLDDISEAIGHLRGEMSSMRHVVESMDGKVDVLGTRLSAVEQFKDRFEGVEASVERHERLVQRGTGVWVMLVGVGSVIGGVVVDAAKKFFP